MIRLFTLMGALALLVTMNTAGMAQDADAGKAKSGTCVACHGTDGNSPLEQFPKIAGQVPDYIADQLAKFKSGERPDPVMMGMVAALSEQDMADMDAWYSSQTMTVGSVSRLTRKKTPARVKTFSVAASPNIMYQPAWGAMAHPVAVSPPTFPRLGGQHAAYIETALQGSSNPAPMDTRSCNRLPLS